MTSPAVSGLFSRSLSTLRKEDEVLSEEPEVNSRSGRFYLIVGISILVYLLLGGLMFHFVEQPNESTSNDEIRAAVVEYLAENPGIDHKNLSSLLVKVSKAFSSGFRLGENGSVTVPPSKWDYPGSVFFCITVVTTIGYGNLSPSTVAGQAVCCLYALVGIPMLAVLLSGIADWAKAAQLRFHRVACWRGRGRLPVAATTALYILIGLVMFFIVPASVFVFTEGWSFGVGMYYSLVSLSTIGFGDYVAGQTYTSDVYRLSLTLWIFLGMVYVSGLINAVQVSMERGTQAVHAKSAALQLRIKETGSAKLDRDCAEVVDIESADGGMDSDNLTSSISKKSNPAVAVDPDASNDAGEAAAPSESAE